jgi:hypothetical protein
MTVDQPEMTHPAPRRAIMSVQICPFPRRPPAGGEIEEAIGRLFTAVAEAAPSDIEYIASRVGDGPDFLVTLELLDDAPNPLLEVPEAKVFRAQIGEWTGGPVLPSSLHIIGRYSG